MNLYQYKQEKISKEFLLTTGYERLYRDDQFKMDNECVFLMDVSEAELPLGKTLVYNLRTGISIDPRPTRQLVNEFYQMNGIGFSLAKVLADHFGIKRYIPFIHGYTVYMPMTGATRNNASWIAPQLAKEAKQVNKKVRLTTLNNYEIEIDFPKGDFEQRLHDVALLSKASFLFFKYFVNAGSCNLQPPAELGLLAKYENCQCEKHLRMLKEMYNFRNMILWMKTAYLLNLGIGAIERDELIKYYNQNLARFKRNY